MRNKIPLIRLPNQLETILYLIGEELKSRHLFSGLQKVELHDCYFQPHLDLLIIQNIGLGEDDETILAYERILDKRSKKIEADKDSIMRQALKVYEDLKRVKKSQKPSV